MQSILMSLQVVLLRDLMKEDDWYKEVSLEGPRKVGEHYIGMGWKGTGR